MILARHRTERGAATAELVVAMPLLLLLVMGVVQFALWQHATHVAEAAAQEGARATRLEGGNVSVGQDAAKAYLDKLGRDIVANPRVSVTRTVGTARVDITGTSEPVIPFLSLPVRASSEGPIERFIAPGAVS